MLTIQDKQSTKVRHGQKSSIVPMMLYLSRLEVVDWLTCLKGCWIPVPKIDMGAGKGRNSKYPVAKT